MFGDYIHSLSRVYLFMTSCSTPGFHVLHHLPEAVRTNVYWFSDAIQPSRPLLSPLLLPSIFSSIRVFSNKPALRIRWPKYWSFSFSTSPSNEYSGLISFRMDLGESPCCPRDFQESSPAPVQKYQFLGAQPSLWSNSHICTWIPKNP